MPRISLSELVYDVRDNGLVTVERVSPLTGKASTMDLPITAEQLMEFCQDENRVLIQKLLPTCKGAEREFLKTGYTPEDWKVMFPPMGDSEDNDSDMLVKPLGVR